MKEPVNEKYHKSQFSIYLSSFGRGRSAVHILSPTAG